MPRLNKTKAVTEAGTNPHLDELLGEDESSFKSFIVELEGQLSSTTTNPQSPLGSRRFKFMRLNDDLQQQHQPRLENDFDPSRRFDDYIEVDCATSMRQLELYGAQNSLFLAVARALLYKCHYVDRRYAHLVRLIYAECLENGGDGDGDENERRPHELRFNSDMRLQEALRRSLCAFWLGFVYNGEFKADCKYSRYSYV